MALGICLEDLFRIVNVDVVGTVYFKLVYTNSLHKPWMDVTSAMDCYLQENVQKNGSQKARRILEWKKSAPELS